MLLEGRTQWIYPGVGRVALMPPGPKREAWAGGALCASMFVWEGRFLHPLPVPSGKPLNLTPEPLNLWDDHSVSVHPECGLSSAGGGSWASPA